MRAHEGLNIKTEKWGDMYKMGVIDPLKGYKVCFFKCSKCGNNNTYNKRNNYSRKS